MATPAEATDATSPPPAVASASPPPPAHVENAAASAPPPADIENAAASAPPPADIENPAPPGHPSPALPAPPAVAAAAAAAATPRGGSTGEGGSVVRSIVQKWRRENLIGRSGVVLRLLAALLSLITIVVLGSNKHGGGWDFDLYQEYRYLMAIAVLVFLYTAGQVARQVNVYRGGKDVVPKEFAGLVDFAVDQIAAYLLLSALSAAIPITNRMREGADNSFTDASSASISMAFFAFVALALSALLSGFKVSRQTYI